MDAGLAFGQLMCLFARLLKRGIHMNTKKLIYASLFAALTAIGAFISIPIPFSLVPITLQTPITLSSGYLLGSNYGALSQLVYLFIGALGLPVFANQTGGVGILYGPTSGFLWGFVVAAFIVGKIRLYIRHNTVGWLLLIMVSGMIIIYVCGIFGLVLTMNYDWKQAFFAGVAPLLPTDFVKLLITSIFISKLNRYFK